MKITRYIQCFIFLFGILTTSIGTTQGLGQETQLAMPDPASLKTNWWNYFEGSPELVEPRVTAFLKSNKDRIANLDPQNQEFALSILSIVSDNFTVLISLKGETEPTPQKLEPLAASYSIKEMLQLSELARRARDNAAEEQIEVDREKRVLNGATRHRDAAFDNYLDAKGKDDRWLVGLKLLQARTTLAVSKRRLELLTQRTTRATDYAQLAEARLDQTLNRLSTSNDRAELNRISKRLDADRIALTTAQENLQTTQIAASGLDVDTEQGRSQQRLQQQKLLHAQIDLAVAKTVLASTTAQKWWTETTLNSAISDSAELGSRVLQWSELVRSIEQQIPDWQQLTEEELLTVQSFNQKDHSRASRRLLDQRLSTAKKTLTQIKQLKTRIADLRLLMRVVDKTNAEYAGAVNSWLSSLSRAVQTAYIRVVEIGKVTLFSVSETPVTGGDILKALLILIVAFLLSRGTRHAIQRISDGESGGAQASLYTLGRLSHYAIIILGLFIALTSLGFNFGTLALVAGALSVGIGFGLQSIVNNFVSGLIILFEHSLRVGDYIELDTGLTGTVKSINVRSTLINTNDNIDIVVPNSEFVTTRLTNWTLGEHILRIRIPFGVAYGSDKELVKKAATEAAAEVSYTLTHMRGRDPEVWLTEFGDNSLNFLLLVWVNRQGARSPTRARAAYLWELETKLSEYNIEIPFPQHDLHLRSGWPITTAQNLSENP
jgi:small-conductance mechanosensitive channel